MLQEILYKRTNQDPAKKERYFQRCSSQCSTAAVCTVEETSHAVQCTARCTGAGEAEGAVEASYPPVEVVIRTSLAMMLGIISDW